MHGLKCTLTPDKPNMNKIIVLAITLIAISYPVIMIVQYPDKYSIDQYYPLYYFSFFGFYYGLSKEKKK